MRTSLFLLTLAAIVSAQTTPQDAAKQKDQGAVSGQLRNSVTNEPVRKAKVTLRASDPSKTPYTINTDNEGKFLLENVEPGRYSVSGERQGFVTENYGATRPMGPGSVLDLRAGKTIADLDIRMVPQGVIAGRVLDDEGEPVAGVNVSALHYVYMLGRKRLMPAGVLTMPIVTNDLGEYRISGLPPDKYFVQSAAQKLMNLQAGTEKASGKAPAEGLVPAFFPNATDVSSASPVQVGPGAEVRGIDIRLKKVHVQRVSGVLMNGAEPVKNGMLMIYRREPGGMQIMPSGMYMVQGGKGTFELRDIPPGSYSVLAIATGDPQNMALSMTKIEVADEPLQDLNLNIGAGIDVPVSTRFADGASVPASPDPGFDLSNIRVALQIDDNPLASMSVAQIDKERKGVLKRVNPDKYKIVVAGVPPKAFLQSARLGGADVLQEGLDLRGGAVAGTLDLVFGAPPAELSGSVRNEKGEPVRGAVVTLVPKKPGARIDLSRTASTDQNGSFTIPGVVPAEYTVFAWEDIEGGAADDADFRKPFEKLAAAVDLSSTTGAPAVQLSLITKAAVQEAQAAGKIR